MNRLSVLKDFFKVWREGRYLGDLVALRAGLNLGTFNPTPTIAKLLQTQSVPDFSDLDFSKMPKGSFGKAYHNFLNSNGLKPFIFSGKYKGLMEQHKLAVFYASVHDLFHVLTGYNTTLAGEAGVWAFVYGQDISPQAKLASRMTQILYPIVKPFQYKAIQEAYREGKQNGENATCLLTVDFKIEFLNPLTEVRNKYNVKPTQIKKAMDPLCLTP